MKIKNNITLKKDIQKFQKTIGIALLIFCLVGTQSCENTFLDVVPDNVTTIDQAFALRNEAEKYLFTCYSYMPLNGDMVYNIAFLAGNETWIPPQDAAIDSNAFDIARGLQNVSNPFMDVWEGKYQGGGPPYPGVTGNYRIWNGIRHCNIFIETLEDRRNVPDLGEAERLRWIAEAKFLKAYYHYYMMRIYGPIPIMRKAIPVDAPEDELQVSREPVEDVINYVVNLLTESATNLPPQIVDLQDELGRVTRPAALGLKAEVLLTAASPLFNGNSDMSDFVNKDGTPFFNATYDPTKWQKAADALKTAIEAAEATGHHIFYKEDIPYAISQTTKTKLDIRQAITERWNPEVIWFGSRSGNYELQRGCMAPLSADILPRQARMIMAPTMNSALKFYTKNGVPIEEDKDLKSTFDDITQLRTAGLEEQLNIKFGYTTSVLNYNREPRFYADLGFDGAIWYLNSSGATENKYYLKAKYQDYAGSSDAFDYNVTGYFTKKLVDWETTFTGGTTYKEYAWPELRLADLYLMYAEALNEVSGPTPEVLQYIDAVRERAGLEGVATSWQNYSVNPSKYTSQSGMRDIIRKERSIELAFEGKNFWDIRRWKTASQELNQPIQGWNVYGNENATYYQVNTLFQQSFVAPRDYFWPLSELTLIQNPNLVQNPGW